ncbi:unnamed protein product [Dicrocoelium dendriticum]|nr:unnamed protein product [Dicrocoelium dendriticum]
MTFNLFCRHFAQMDLAEADPEIMALCRAERQRQFCGLEMIASENFVSRAVLQALSSSFHNKYSEGQVGSRYYGGNEVVDVMELLCQNRALSLFGLDPTEWGVNVQPHSGSPANFAVLTALAGPHGRIMGLDLPDGGHLTHGFQAPSGKKVSATSLFFESVPYKVDPDTGLIDYDALQKTARLFRPKIIIAGTSAYSRWLDYARFREIADSVSAILFADMAHISGLVACGLHPSPFEYCDVVTTTTHKTLRGPRAALIFYRKLSRSKPIANKKQDAPAANGAATDFERLINEAVFPGLQGGPHNNSIAAIAVALKEASSSEFKVYQQQVLTNMHQFCTSLMQYGYKLVTDGSDTHLCLLDLRPNGLDGVRVEKVLEQVGIAVNKNTCPGDLNALRPGGIRFGSPALTTRGLTEPDFVYVASLIHEAIQLTHKVKQLTTSNLLKDFLTCLKKDQAIQEEVTALKEKVIEFATKFPLPGMDY